MNLLFRAWIWSILVAIYLLNLFKKLWDIEVCYNNLKLKQGLSFFSLIIKLLYIILKMKLTLTFAIICASLQNLPLVQSLIPCENFSTSNSNRCFNVTCDLNRECQSGVCMIGGKCDSCTNSDKPDVNTKCEGNQCSGNNECKLNVCYYSFCDADRTGQWGRID